MAAGAAPPRFLEEVAHDRRQEAEPRGPDSSHCLGCPLSGAENPGEMGEASPKHPSAFE